MKSIYRLSFGGYGSIYIDLKKVNGEEDQPFIEIIKLEDDWFYVKDYHEITYYKCDQWDGVLKLLKDIHII